MIQTKLALKLFEAFSIERWNDLVRPFDMVEMDKSGERMVLAYIIGKYEEERGAEIDWHWMVYAKLEFLNLSTCCQTEQLVAETDTEDRLACLHSLADVSNSSTIEVGVTGTCGHYHCIVCKC